MSRPVYDVEIVASTPQISELWLMPVLEACWSSFLFVIRRFHSDNASEFINYNVAHLLEKLLNFSPAREHDFNCIYTFQPKP